MKDGLADGLARVKERVGSLRGRGDSGDRYVLLPAEAGRRRRLAEVGAVAGVGIVVLALVGATVAMRSSSSDSPVTPGPGLPAPTEFAVPPSGSVSPTGSAATVPAPGPGGPVPTGPGRTFPRGTPVPTGTPTLPAPTTRVSTPVPPTTTVPPPPTPTTTVPPPTTDPPPTTTPPSPSVSPTAVVVP